MKRRLLGIALLGAAVWMTTADAQGFGGGRRASSGCGTSSCGTSTGCNTGCGGSYQVSYVDQKVTAYKTEWETKDVKVTTNEWVTVKEDYKYWVSEPVTTKQKYTVKEWKSKEEPYKYTVKEMKSKEEPFKYMVNEWATVKEKVKVAEHKPVTKEVEVTTYECVPTVTKQQRTVCEWVCVPVQVTCTVAAPSCGNNGGIFHRLCNKGCAPASNCGGCEPACPQVVTKTVMQRQQVSRVVECDVTTYTRVAKKSMQKVTTYETNWVEKEVEVKKCVPVEKTGTKTVCFWVDVEKSGTKTVHFSVDVEKEKDVTTYKQVEKMGTREVKKCMPVEKVVKQQFAKSVPYETTVKVAVYTFVPAPAPAPAPGATPCDSHASPCGTTGGCGTGARGGLFRGRTHGCGGCN